MKHVFIHSHTVNRERNKTKWFENLISFFLLQEKHTHRFKYLCDNDDDQILSNIQDSNTLVFVFEGENKIEQKISDGLSFLEKIKIKGKP